MNKERNIYFDVLRGFFIFLALWQHYAYFLNVYFIDYFRESELIGFLYKNFEGQVGLTQNYLPSDNITVTLSDVFTPFVSQIFLTLACFNLARPLEEFKKVFSKKIKSFVSIFLFFYLENIIVSTSAGDALSLNPINTWMMVLAFISCLYYLFDYKFLFFAIPISFLLVGDYNFGIEDLIKSAFHPDFRIDASPHYFFPSSLVGFALGLINTNGKNKKIFKILLPLFGFMFIVGRVYSPQYATAMFDILLNEHLKALTVSGTLEILGIQGFLVCLAMILPKVRFLNFFEYVGKESLFIFAIHRIFFLKIWIPLYIHIILLMGFPLKNNIPLVWGSIFLNIFFCMALKKSRIIQTILGDK